MTSIIINKAFIISIQLQLLNKKRDNYFVYLIVKFKYYILKTKLHLDKLRFTKYAFGI